VTGAPSYAETPGEGTSSLTMEATTRGVSQLGDVLERLPERVISMVGGYGIRGVRNVLDRFPHPLFWPAIHSIH